MNGTGTGGHRCDRSRKAVWTEKLMRQSYQFINHIGFWWLLFVHHYNSGAVVGISIYTSQGTPLIYITHHHSPYSPYPKSFQFPWDTKANFTPDPLLAQSQSQSPNPTARTPPTKLTSPGRAPRFLIYKLKLLVLGSITTKTLPAIENRRNWPHSWYRDNKWRVAFEGRPEGLWASGMGQVWEVLPRYLEISISFKMLDPAVIVRNPQNSSRYKNSRG